MSLRANKNFLIILLYLIVLNSSLDSTMDSTDVSYQLMF